MVNVSAAMGGQFAWSAAEFTEEIKRLGPNRLKNLDIRLNNHRQVVNINK